MLLYQKNTFGRKYTRLITHTPVFIIFIILGVGLFLALTLTTQINVIRTYSAEAVQNKDTNGISLLIKAEGIIVRSAYVYSNRNEAVYPVLIENSEQAADKMLLHLGNNDQKIINTLSPEKIFIDIPQGKESLLYRILVKGGKGIE